jgi:membrane-bound ClpP family serine protease
MNWIRDHASQLFLLFPGPIIGLIFDFYVSRKVIISLLGIAVLLLAPLMAGYDYTIAYFAQTAGLLALGCLYYFVSLQIERSTPKIAVAFSLSAVLFFLLGFLAALDKLAGHQKVEKSWKIGSYNIEYILDKGFAGRPSMYYKVSQYGPLPVLIKQVDVAAGEDTSCVIHFTGIKKEFNKCNLTLQDVQ